MPPTDRKRRQRLDPEARRSAILAAAAAVFAELPYHDVTIGAVAARAGASNALLYRYFDGKEDLYAAVVATELDALLADQRAALTALPAGVPARDRVRAITAAYVAHVARLPAAWALPLRAPSTEPESVTALRSRARAAHVELLREQLAPSDTARHVYALHGHFGFVDAACLDWAARGCPPHETEPLIAAALGALEGALGDWAA